MSAPNVIPTRNHKRIISQATARDAPVPEGAAYLIWDERVPYFGLRVYPGGAKTWFVQKKLNGKPCRVVIGPFPSITYTKAKESVAGIVARISAGIDPNLEARQTARENAKIRQDERFSVRLCLEAYIADRKALERPPTANTLRDLASALSRLDKFMGRLALLDLTGAKLAEYYDRSAKSKTATRGGRTQAGRDLRSLRAAYTLCMAKFRLTLPEQNPFVELNRLRKDWYRTKARSGIVAATEGDLAKWWAAVDSLRPPKRYKSRAVIADYLQLSLLWGGRRAETLSLRWSDVNLDDDYVLIPQSVTKSKRDHLFPLTRYAKKMLLERKEANASAPGGRSSIYVFPSRRPNKTGEYTHIVEPGSALQVVTSLSGIDASPHSLRKTFGTLWNEMDVSDETVNRALNHRSRTTAGIHYIHSRLHTLRDIYQRYEDKVLSEAGVVTEQVAMTISVNADDYAKFMAWQAAQEDAGRV